MTLYRDDFGNIFDESELEDRVREAFDEGEFSNYVDDNFEGLDAEGYSLWPSKILELMGDFDAAYDDAVAGIMHNRGGDLPDLDDLGIHEIADDEDDDDYAFGSDCRRTARGGASKPRKPIPKGSQQRRPTRSGNRSRSSGRRYA